MPSLSIIIPFRNEAENVSAVMDEILAFHPAAEIIAVDDASTDDTKSALSAYPIRYVALASRGGKGRAVYAGLSLATAPITAIIDGDGQYDPKDITTALERLLREKLDLINGCRQDRCDSHSTKLASAVANGIRRHILNDSVRDAGSGLKIFRTSTARQLLIPFEGMHRYITTIFEKTGKSIAEMPINHRPRLHGTSHYTHTGRALRSIPQMIKVARHIKKLNKSRA